MKGHFNPRNIQLNGNPQEWLDKIVHDNNLVREKLAKGEAIIHCADTNEQIVATMTDSKPVVIEHRINCEEPAGADDIIIEEGLCRTGNAMELTEGLPDPFPLIIQNFKFAQKAERCGCIHCGAILKGEEITESVKDTEDDRIKVAICPVCHFDTIVVEEDDIVVNENNLWRWFQHMSGYRGITV